VLDFVEDRLADKFSLAELAEVAELSAMHFARQFKRATGLSPHQYVLRCRIARAKAFLKLSPHPLAHIAQAVGFSSQSHMTTVFSRNVGSTRSWGMAVHRATGSAGPHADAEYICADSACGST
jgi:AraC family transcriptional regulator